MTHLKITLSDTSEMLGSSSNTIGARIIKKLYELALAGLDNTSELSGVVSVDKAHRNAVEYLLNHTNLRISVTGGYYIDFEDPLVEQLLMSKNVSSDGFGVTEADAQAITRPGDAWFKNTNITSFDEFKYFTNIDHSYSHVEMFAGCTQLESITLPPHYAMWYGEFYNCTSLKYINFENVDSIGPRSFENTDILIINATGLLSVGWNSFINSGVKNVTSLGNITELTEGNFAQCSNLESVILPSTCTTLGTWVFSTCPKLSLINVENIQTIGSYCFIDSPMLPKVMNFLNLTQYYRADTTGHFTFSSVEHIYVPKLLKLIGGYDQGGNNCKGPFIRGGWDIWRTPLINVLYLRDVMEVETGCFCGARVIKNIIVNNITPPTVTAFSQQKQDLLIDGGDSALASCNLYVPDASVSLYQNHQYWGEFGNRIKPLSLMSKVATRTLWDLLTDVQKADTLIEEYM